MFRKWLAAALVVFTFGGFIWASDQITIQGERTVYTVECANGEWQGVHCTGSLKAGDRHTFRASRARQEVLYWIVGSKQPSGKFSDCQVKDRGNWKCSVGVDQPETITQEMKHDIPARGATGPALPFHAVPKWKWWVIRADLASFADASI
jgi:hypothetical protein